MQELYIQYADMKDRFFDVLVDTGFSKENAEQCGAIFADNTLDGVASHGVNRFPLFIEQCRNGVVDIDAVPEKVGSVGCIEQWDGKSGVGPLNALKATDRSVEIAAENGIGCVALKNNTHWMRGGTYGRRAASRGFLFICWTNTKPNMAPPNCKVPLVGNNPFVLAVPRDKGHLVLDMAMSQYSYGKMELYERTNREMEFQAGYDDEGKMTKDPGTIIRNSRVLPIGIWKGSGLAIMLDLFASVLSGGAATRDIPFDEPNLSQIYLAFAAHHVTSREQITRIGDELVEFLKSVPEKKKEGEVRYPGEGTLARREQNKANGIPVDAKTWQRIVDL